MIVNPETAPAGPGINYAAQHHVQLISVDTIVGVGKVYMVVRASNLLYGWTRAPTSARGSSRATWWTWRAT